MSTPLRPSTPITQTSTLQTPQTGTWRHPQFDEIARRQNATNFSDRNVRKMLYNALGIFMFWTLEHLLRNNIPSLHLATEPFKPYTTYFYCFVQIVLIYNIIVALLPLVKRKDELSDIALTPAQRKLLGLPPSSAPPTPGLQYVTPPRYARTPTPLSGSPASKGSYLNSPLSGKGSPASGDLLGSPFSPSTSPLLQKAIGGGLNGSRRHSYGSPSPLGPVGARTGVPETPGTPSPSIGKGASVGLNNRWLFEKGRRNSGTSRLYS
jgi:nucleoporin POM34